MWKIRLSKIITLVALVLVLLNSTILSSIPANSALAPKPSQTNTVQEDGSSVGDRIYQNNDENSADLEFSQSLASGGGSCSDKKVKDAMLNGTCWLNFLINLPGLIVSMILQIIGAIVDMFMFIILKIIEIMISQNPAAQGTPFFDLAVQTYAVTLSIANLMILFSFFYVGYRYLFGLQDKVMGWQEFLVKVVAATILVNFSIYIVSIFVSILHDIGGLLVNIFSIEGSNSIGGAFQISVKIAAGYSADNFNPRFDSPFSSPADFYANILVQLLYPIIGVFILIELFKLIKIVITRFVLLFLLLVVSPVAIVCYFSPIDVFRKKGQEWLKTLWVQTSLYPVFVIVLGIGSFFIVGFGQAADDAGLAGINEDLGRILSLFVAYGVVKVLVNFFEDSFKGVAEGLWKQMGTAAIAAGGVVGAAGMMGFNALNGMRKGAVASFNAVGNSGGGNIRNGLAKVTAGGIGALGGLAVGGISDPRAIISAARRVGIGAGMFMDTLGNDSVKRLSDTNKLVGAWVGQTQTEFGQLGDAAIRKAGQGIGAERFSADLADQLGWSPVNAGRLGSEIGSMRDNVSIAGSEGRETFDKKMGINRNLSDKSLLKGLDSAVDDVRPGETVGSYHRHKIATDELVRAAKKRPSLLANLSEAQQKYLQENYKDIAASNPEWRDLVAENVPHLAHSSMKRDLAEKIVKMNYDSDEFRRYDKTSMMKDPEMAQHIMEALDNPTIGANKEEFAKKVGVDLSSFDSNITGRLLKNPTSIDEKVAKQVVSKAGASGLARGSRSGWHKKAEEVLEASGESLATAGRSDIRSAFVASAETAVESEFYGHQADKVKTNINNARTASELRSAVAGSPKAKSIIEAWESESGKRMSDSDVSAVKSSIHKTISTAKQVLTDASNSAVDDQVDHFISNNSRFKLAKEDHKDRLERTALERQAGSLDERERKTVESVLSAPPTSVSPEKAVADTLEKTGISSGFASRIASQITDQHQKAQVANQQIDSVLSGSSVPSSVNIPVIKDMLKKGATVAQVEAKLIDMGHPNAANAANTAVSAQNVVVQANEAKQNLMANARTADAQYREEQNRLRQTGLDHEQQSKVNSALANPPSGATPDVAAAQALQQQGVSAGYADQLGAQVAQQHSTAQNKAQERDNAIATSPVGSVPPTVDTAKIKDMIEKGASETEVESELTNMGHPDPSNAANTAVTAHQEVVKAEQSKSDLMSNAKANDSKYQAQQQRAQQQQAQQQSYYARAGDTQIFGGVFRGEAAALDEFKRRVEQENKDAISLPRGTGADRIIQDMQKGYYIILKARRGKLFDYYDDLVKNSLIKPQISDTIKQMFTEVDAFFGQALSDAGNNPDTVDKNQLKALHLFLNRIEDILNKI